jgi:hypothetical protein
MNAPDSPKHFWTTLPGILSGAAALITAVVGALALFIKNGENDAVAPLQESAARKQQFLLAGMHVTCDKPSMSSFVGIRDTFADSSPSARFVAHSMVTVLLRRNALEDGETNQAYECTFDDPSYYVQVVPIGPRAIGTIEHCRAYRQTFSSSSSEGKRITTEETACLKQGIWTPR